MTGKKRKNSKSYWVEDTPEKLDYINETLYEENMNLNKELDKYKRAFEILKKESNVRLEKMAFDDYYLYYIIYYGTYSVEITKEEYELLKELMKGE